MDFKVGDILKMKSNKTRYIIEGITKKGELQLKCIDLESRYGVKTTVKNMERFINDENLEYIRTSPLMKLLHGL